MTILIPLLIGVAVAAVVGLVAWLVPARPAAVERQLRELEHSSALDDPGVSTRRQRHSQQLKAVLEFVGERVNEQFQVGEEIMVALFSNRLGAMHSWTIGHAPMLEDPAESARIYREFLAGR